jgi:hypothetical protein
VLADDEVIASVQAANPLALLAIVEEQILANGDPIPPYSVVLRRGANRQCLVVDSALIGSRGAATSDQHRIDALRTIDGRIVQYLKRHGDSSSMTIMTDTLGNPISTKALLRTIFSSSS